MKNPPLNRYCIYESSTEISVRTGDDIHYVYDSAARCDDQSPRLVGSYYKLGEAEEVFAPLSTDIRCTESFYRGYEIIMTEYHIESHEIIYDEDGNEIDYELEDIVDCTLIPDGEEVHIFGRTYIYNAGASEWLPSETEEEEEEEEEP